MRIQHSGPPEIKPAPKDRIPAVSLAFAVAVLALVPLAAHCAPILFDRYGPL